MSSPLSEIEGPQILGGQGSTFILGAFAGFTSNKIGRLVTENGGTVAREYTDVELERVIVSPSLYGPPPPPHNTEQYRWAAQGTASASLIIKNILAANESNATEEYPDNGRVWLLPIEWLHESIKAGKLLHENNFDLDRTVQARRITRITQLVKENSKLGARKYAPGERRREEAQARMKMDMAADAEAVKLEEAMLAKAGFARATNGAGPSGTAARPAPVISSRHVATPPKNVHRTTGGRVDWNAIRNDNSPDKKKVNSFLDRIEAAGRTNKLEASSEAGPSGLKRNVEVITLGDSDSEADDDDIQIVEHMENPFKKPRADSSSD